MKRQENIDAWMHDAPEEVRRVTDDLLAQVQGMRDEGCVVYPAQDAILNALAYTGPEQVKAVILGQDPYHEPGQAMGLSFSVPQGQKLPPSLRNIYKEMAADLGCEPPASGDLTGWAEQGVLLLNTTLTVREHAANSHSKLGWQTLTNYLVERCFELEQPVVFLAWGRFAVGLVEHAGAGHGMVCAGEGSGSGKATGAGAGAEPDAAAEGAARAGTGSAEAAGSNKFVLTSTHPSPLSASRAAGGLRAFLGSRPFSRANALLMQAGAQPIDWARTGA